METKEALINIGNRLCATVDLEDLPELSRNRWFAEDHKYTYYATRMVKVNGKRKHISMHHQILGKPPDGMETDHINGNGLDNRKANLRFCTHRQNMQAGRKRTKGTSEFKGVTWDKNRRKWRVRIMNLGQQLNIGEFNSELDAAAAYDEAAMEMFGQFATLNLPNRAECEDRLFPEK